MSMPPFLYLFGSKKPWIPKRLSSLLPNRVSAPFFTFSDSPPILSIIDPFFLETKSACRIRIFRGAAAWKRNYVADKRVNPTQGLKTAMNTFEKIMT